MCSASWSGTIRTARARTSGEYGGTRFVMAPSSQELEPPGNPGRFTVGETLDLIDAADKPALFVLNNAATNAKLTNQALTILSQHGTVAAVDGQPVIIHTRTDFRSAMTDGRVAQEIKPKSKAAEEIANLWKAVKARLEKETRRRGRPGATA